MFRGGTMSERIPIVNPFRCAHLPVTLPCHKKLSSAAHSVLNSRVIRATMLIEINSSAQELEYVFYVRSH